MSMLACARIGAPHSVVFGGFAAKELASRIAHASPKLVISANCGIEPNKIVPYKPILDEAISLSGVSGLKCLIFNRQGHPPADLKTGRDFDWNESVGKVTAGHDPVPVPAEHPLYVLYTSGTTGKIAVYESTVAFRSLQFTAFQEHRKESSGTLQGYFFHV